MEMSGAQIVDFNCTIQELKHRRENYVQPRSLQFQLHHTGIKTDGYCAAVLDRAYFNCTIQELKLFPPVIVLIQRQHFNCTIQELKLTLKELKSRVRFMISIAPYRN